MQASVPGEWGYTHLLALGYNHQTRSSLNTVLLTEVSSCRHDRLQTQFPGSLPFPEVRMEVMVERRAKSSWLGLSSDQLPS